jgi:phosphate transport system protein
MGGFVADTRCHFETAVSELKEQLVDIGITTEEVVDLSVKCFLERDPRLCSQILSLESKMKQRERQIDETAVHLLGHPQLRSSHLRLLTACLKINTNLERIGTLAVNIADLSLSDYRPGIFLPREISSLGNAASSMVQQTLRGFADSDEATIDATIDLGEVVAQIGNDAWVHLVNEMREAPGLVDQALSSLMVVRNLERVAGYAIRIAQDILFWVYGVETRHAIRCFTSG